jgi:ubiquinone biosynthesis protein
MIFFQIRLAVLQFFRFLEILQVVIRHILREFISRNRFIKKRIKSDTLNPEGITRTPERIRLAIEELGPTFIKFGQILADRPDLVSENLRMELKKLQSTAKPLSDVVAREILEHELGGSISDFFEDFKEKHIASASIGQTYVGILKGGKKVVVKVQRPNIEEKIKLDLLLLQYLARRMVKRYPDLAILNVERIVAEFKDTILSELDYLNEAGNMMRFKQMFLGDDRVKVPEVYHEYTTKKILIQEFIDGIPPDRLDLMYEKGIDPKVIAYNGADLLLHMILKHGFFHADPHAGNIFVLPGNVICFIDFGMVGNLKQRHIHFMGEFTIGLMRKDAKALAKSMLKLSGIKYFNQMEELEFEMEKILQRYSYIPVEKMNFSQILQESINVVVKYQLHVPSNFFMLLKALATIEKFAVRLNPQMELGTLLRSYAISLVQSRFGIRQIAANLYQTVSDYVTLIRELPGEVNEILYKVKEGKLIHEIDLVNKRDFQSSLSKFSYRIALSLVLGFIMVTSAIMLVWGEGNQRLANLMLTISLIMALIVGFRWFFKSRQGPAYESTRNGRSY